MTLFPELRTLRGRGVLWEGTGWPLKCKVQGACGHLTPPPTGSDKAGWDPGTKVLPCVGWWR